MYTAQTTHAGSQEEHIALAQELLGTVAADDGTRIVPRCHLEGNTGGKVGLDNACDDIHRGALGGQNHMDTGSTGFLSQSHDGGLDIFGGDSHQICKFVHDHDNLRNLLTELLIAHRIFVSESLTPLFGLFDFGIIARKITDIHRREHMVAPLHLVHDPAKRQRGLFGVHDNGQEQMGDAVINLELQHLGVDHDHSYIFRRGLKENAHDHAIHRDTLTSARCARHQKVRHLGQILHHHIAFDIFTETHGEHALALFEVVVSDDFFEEDHLAFLIWDLDAHSALAGQRSDDTNAQSFHTHGYIIGQTCNFGDLRACCGNEFVHGDDGTGSDFPNDTFDAVVFEGLGELIGLFPKCHGINRLSLVGCDIQELRRGEH